MKKINPAKTTAWQALQAHFQKVANVSLQDYFKKDASRTRKFTLHHEDLSVDLSKNHIDEVSLDLLVNLAREVDLSDAMVAYFSGVAINETENRAVLHTALRAGQEAENILVDGQKIRPLVEATLEQMRVFSEKVITGDWKGHTGKAITDVVNIGIGGSDLGPQMVVEALQYNHNHLKTHFISNIDGDHVLQTLKGLNPETSLFIIVSKTFTTQETLTNAMTVQRWFLEQLPREAVAEHFVAVSTNLSAVADFGIADENIFPIWDWVGGRFSLWSAVGLAISLAVGFDNFKQLLAGARSMDLHFKNTPLHGNIPVMLALISVWYHNFYQTTTEAVLPYAQSLEKWVAYLQQAVMESNGKGVDRLGQKVTYQTGTIVWGSTGTNMQHAFMQLVHQGTKKIPCDFIGYRHACCGDQEHHKKLMANYEAQMEALCYGRDEKAVMAELPSDQKHLLPFKVFEGNRPSTAILQDKLTPYSLGMLIAMYEHKIFVQGILWNIYSYDQWGVELGKKLANKRSKK